MLYSLYPFFVALWLILDHQPPSRLTLFRVGLATIAVLLLTSVPKASVDMTGVLMMLGASVLYAMHLPINQRVLFEVPAPTVALYTLLAMSAVVIPAYLIFDRAWPVTNVPWQPVAGLTFVTIFSRIALFLGVKKIGGMQTALLGLAELLIAILFSHILLGESLSLAAMAGRVGPRCQPDPGDVRKSHPTHSQWQDGLALMDPRTGLAKGYFWSVRIKIVLKVAANL